GKKAQGRIRRKIEDAAHRIATADPAHFRVIPTTGKREGLVEIRRSPEAFDTRGRTQAYQALPRQGKPRRRPRPQPVRVDQLDLLREMEVSDTNGVGSSEAGQEGAQP